MAWAAPKTVRETNRFNVMLLTPQQEERLRRLRLHPRDFREAFCRSSGPGGQHVNKVETAVYLLHQPSGLHVVCEESRSRAMNRHLALDRLLDKIEQARAAQRQARLAEAAKLRRQKARRSAATRAKLRQEKLRRAHIKQGRARPAWES